MDAARVESEHRVDRIRRVQVRFRLLGPVSAEIGDVPVRLGGPKQRTVLASLLLNANRVVSEDRLVDQLWEREPPASARGQLQVRISELRKLFGRSVIVRRPPGYLIDVRPGALDLRLFDDAVVRARAELSAGRPRAGIRRLREALTWWHGPALGGVTDALATREGPPLEERRMAAWEALFEAEIAAGHCGEVIGELRQATEEHPFRERLLGNLMVALHRCGRSREALEVYAETRRRFAAELGIEPGEDLRDLHLRILKGQDRDRTDVWERLPATGERRRPAGLPCDIRGFAGRAGPLRLLDAQLSASLRSGDHTTDVWVVSGSAGVGKTALVVHWARQVRRHFPDGQLYVNLRGFDADHEPTPPVAALAQLLGALGVDARRIPTGLDEQTGLYRSLLAERRVLLLLDDARSPEQVRPLLPPGGTVLVTSRRRLGALVADIGARSLPLRALPVEDSRAVLVGLLGARQVAAEAEAADELARLCGHLPLALRIAAANLAASPVPSIAGMTGELARRGALATLTVDGAEGSAITRAFELSYEALSPQQRRLFRLLGLVPGPDFTPRAAAALVGSSPDEGARQLDQLAAAHLVEQHVPGRFRFHDLLREYALDRAVADESAAVREQARTRLLELSPSGGLRRGTATAGVLTGQKSGGAERARSSSVALVSRQFHPHALLPSHDSVPPRRPGRPFRTADPAHRPIQEIIE